MTVVVLVHAAVSAVILAFHLAVAAGCLLNLARARARRRAASSAASTAAPLPEVEVVVTVRDEEAALPSLLAALRAQEVVGCRFLLVDDRSRDGTARLLDDFAASLPGRARTLHVTDEPVGLTGKQAALDRALAEVSAEVILFTDGDCVPGPSWVREMAALFADRSVGIVLGRVELAGGRGFLADFQSFEQPLLNQYNLGSAGIGVPTGCFGNNMAVRAAAFRQTGGFSTLGYSLTEDALLLDAVCRGGGWKAAVCPGAPAAITTRGKPTWREFVEQHTRWNAGALFSPDIVTRASYLFIVLFYLVGSILVMPLGVLDGRVPLLSLNAFLSIGILAALGGAYQGKRRGPYFAKLLPYLLFFGFFYSWITLRALVRRRLDWKGASLPTTSHAPRR
jgi:cellulose synthase/poly-beta-1,6-N-acetylglucosamine synthase-like glycosyltransferase